jgi:hypothetical protein
MATSSPSRGARGLRWRTGAWPHRARPGGPTVSAQATACAAPRPHRARPGGAEAWAPEREGAEAHPLCTSRHSTGASPVGAAQREAPFLCRSLHSTGASPVGTASTAQAGLLPPPHPCATRIGTQQTTDYGSRPGRPRHWPASRRLSRRWRAAFASRVSRTSGAPRASCFNNPRAPGTAMCSRLSIARRSRNCSGFWTGPLSFPRISSTRRRISSVGFPSSAFRSVGSATSPSRSSSRAALVRRARLPVSSSSISRARRSLGAAAAGRSRSCRKGRACSGTAIRAQTARYAQAASAPASASHRTGRSLASRHK